MEVPPAFQCPEVASVPGVVLMLASVQGSSNRVGWAPRSRLACRTRLLVAIAGLPLQPVEVGLADQMRQLVRNRRSQGSELPPAYRHGGNWLQFC